MVANKITYFFESNAIKEAFESCLNVIQKEITMTQLFNLNEICTISEISHSDEEYEDGEALVDKNTLKETIEFFIEEYNIDARSLFLSDDQIKDRLEEIITRIKEEDCNRFDFSIKIEKSSNAEILFNVLYAREIKIEQRDDIEVVEYSDFEYQEFFDAIDSIVSENNEIESFEFDHTGGETIDHIEHLDLYYNFKLKKQNKKDLFGNNDEWAVWDSWVGSQTFEEFMNIKTNQTIDEAVDEYINELPEMFPEAIDEFKLNKTYIKNNLISILKKNIKP